MTSRQDDRFILTPRFLTQPLPDLDDLFPPHWVRNTPHVHGNDEIERLVSAYAPLTEIVHHTVQDGVRPVSIAGDCCSSLAVLAGLRVSGIEPTLIWLDAHGDFNTPETSPSGFLGGMPLAMLVGRGDQRLARGVGLQPFAEERVIISDARDLDPLERKALESSRVRHCRELRELIDPVPTPGPLYVHLDTDVTSPSEVPAQNYPAPGGPGAAEVEEVFRALAATGQIAAVSVSTWNPALDRDGRSRLTSMRLLGVLLGREVPAGSPSHSS